MAVKKYAAELFGVPVFKVSYGVSEECIKYIATRQESNFPVQWKCKLTTNACAPTDFIDPAIIADFESIAKEIIGGCGETPKNFQLKSEYWFNHYHNDDFQEPHTHCPSTLSAVWFLKGDPSRFQFCSPLTMWPFVASRQEIETEVGDIIFFPSSLAHYVLPCKEDRMTIALNFHMSFDDV